MKVQAAQASNDLLDGYNDKAGRTFATLAASANDMADELEKRKVNVREPAVIETAAANYRHDGQLDSKNATAIASALLTPQPETKP